MTMKKITFIYIFLSIFTGINAQMYSTSSYLHQKEYERAGYFGQQNQNVNNDYRIGYTTQYGNVYETYHDSYQYSYNLDEPNTDNNSRPGQIRRAIGDHASGSETVTADGYTATITWNVNAAILGLRLWTITYSDGTSETIWCTMEEAKQHAKKVAKDKARQQAEKIASHPDDPFGDPIGNNILPLLLMSLTYFIHKKRKLKTVSV